MKACWPGGVGSGTKRGTTWPGMWTTVSVVCGRTSRLRRPHRDDQAERAVRQVREGVPGIDGERSQDRHQRPAEIVVEEPLLLGRHLLGPHEADPLRGEDRAEVLEEVAVLRVH